MSDSTAYASQNLFDEWWWYDSNGEPLRALTMKEWEVVQQTGYNTWTVEMVMGYEKKSPQPTTNHNSNITAS